MAQSSSVSPFEKLPNDLIVLILERVLEDIVSQYDKIYGPVEDKNRRLSLKRILLPLHLNRRIRSLAMHCPPVWRSIAKIIRVHGPVSIKGYMTLLRLCDSECQRVYAELHTGTQLTISIAPLPTQQSDRNTRSRRSTFDT